MVYIPCLFLRLWNWAWIVLKLSIWCLDRKSYVRFTFLGSTVHIYLHLWVQRLITDIIYSLQFTLFGDMFLFHLSEVNMGTSFRQEIQMYLKSQHWERYSKLMLAESLYNCQKNCKWRNYPFCSVLQSDLHQLCQSHYSRFFTVKPAVWFWHQTTNLRYSALKSPPGSGEAERSSRS